MRAGLYSGTGSYHMMEQLEGEPQTIILEARGVPIGSRIMVGDGRSDLAIQDISLYTLHRDPNKVVPEMEILGGLQPPTMVTT